MSILWEVSSDSPNKQAASSTCGRSYLRRWFLRSNQHAITQPFEHVGAIRASEGGTSSVRPGASCSPVAGSSELLLRR